jgi:hypothetical protein
VPAFIVVAVNHHTFVVGCHSVNLYYAIETLPNVHCCDVDISPVLVAVAVIHHTFVGGCHLDSTNQLLICVAACAPLAIQHCCYGAAT